MKLKNRYLSLLSLCLFLFLPVASGIDNSSTYDNLYDKGYDNGNNNTTEENGKIITLNASHYFNSNSSLNCISAGEVRGNGREVSADGLVENVTLLTNSPESELFPVWTSDGNYILYTVVENESGNSSSYRMKADGSMIDQIGIVEGHLTNFSDVSPYGTELLFSKTINSRSGLYLANLITGKVTPVTDDPNRSESWGAWCRLGDKIVYTQESTDSPSQLWMVNRDGIGRFRLGTSENISIGKDWCPLGQKIIYSARNSKEKEDLWVIDRDGAYQTQLTDTPYGEWNPSFSPDGKKIVYVSDEYGKPDIWIRDINGNFKAKLTTNLGMIDSNPKWSPDGSKIVFTANHFLNESEVNGSDIAVIKLAHEFTVNPDPDVINNN